MKRREFLVAGAGTVPASLLGSALSSGTVSKPASRPNILWIMTDQQPWNLMSCTGNAALHTPAMDSLAAAGVRFDLSYSVNPICVPSRTSMATGRMSHETGVTFNLNRFNVPFECIGKRMKKAGYDTGYVGKWHIPMESSNSDWHGYDLMIEGSDGTKEMNDEKTPGHVINFLRHKRNKPFFLVASFNNPHDICEYARKLSEFPPERSRLWNGSIPDVPPPEQCPSLPFNFEIPENEPDVLREHQAEAAPGIYPVLNWTDGQWRQYRWALNRLTERVDSEIAKILEALRAEGLDKNTVILFTSDHGDGNAAHRWNQKTVLYEEVVKVPLIISGPGIVVPGRTDREHLVSSGLDLFPTFCDYAGINPPSGLKGLSLRPLAEGQPSEWRNEVVSECDLSKRYGSSGGVYGRMLRTQRYKYIVYSSGTLREQLFDIKNDPGEMNNLAVNSDYQKILQEHRERLAAKIQETGDSFVVPGISYEGWILGKKAAGR